MVKITSFEDAFHGLSNILFEKDPNPVKQSDLSRVERSARGTERKHTVSKEKTRDRIFRERRSRDAEPRKVEIDGRPPAPIQLVQGGIRPVRGRIRAVPTCTKRTRGGGVHRRRLEEGEQGGSSGPARPQESCSPPVKRRVLRQSTGHVANQSPFPGKKK